MVPWGYPRRHDVCFRRCDLPRLRVERCTSSQLVVCDMVDSVCYVVTHGQCVCVWREECHMHPGQVQLNQIQGHELDLELLIRARSRKWHWTPGCDHHQRHYRGRGRFLPLAF